MKKNALLRKGIKKTLKTEEEVFRAKEVGLLSDSDFVEILFFSTAFRANPVVRQVGKGGTRLYAMFVITFRRVIHVSARAFILVHWRSPYGCTDSK